jgi:Putative prokaryotic signal transducing protein
MKSKNNHSMKLVELYDGTLFECQMIKNLLENDGIESFLKDEIIGTRSPGWRPGGGVKLIVSDFDYEKAKKIVNTYEKSRQSE